MRSGIVRRMVVAASLAPGLGALLFVAVDARVDAAAQPEIVTQLAKGTFDVKLTPQDKQDKEEDAEGISLSQMTIDKQFHGELQGTSKGEMLSAITGVQGSAGYVAMERVRGTLAGRSGTFVLQHSGVMNRGTPELRIIVVPDSGSGGLQGLAGSMSIKIEGGKHFYEFGYTLPEN